VQPPDKKPKPSPTGTDRPKAYDYLLDPVPVPEAVESDSDTAWGLWELSLADENHADKPASNETARAGFADTTPSDLAGGIAPPEGITGFDGTVPMGLDELPPMKKK